MAHLNLPLADLSFRTTDLMEVLGMDVYADILEDEAQKGSYSQIRGTEDYIRLIGSHQRFWFEGRNRFSLVLSW